jgi:hypothetical protein
VIVRLWSLEVSGQKLGTYLGWTHQEGIINLSFQFQPVPQKHVGFNPGNVNIEKSTETDNDDSDIFRPTPWALVKTSNVAPRCFSSDSPSDWDVQYDVWWKTSPQPCGNMMFDMLTWRISRGLPSNLACLQKPRRRRLHLYKDRHPFGGPVAHT